jgi:hypothetical protein
VERLDQVGATILGILLNKVTRQHGRYYGYAYAYKPYSAEAPLARRNGHLNGSGKVQSHRSQ